MAVILVPSLSECSSSMEVMQLSMGCATLVASNLPPMPVSMMAQSTRCSANNINAAAVSTSKKLGARAASRISSSPTWGCRRANKAANAVGVDSLPPTRKRSLQRCKCGEVKTPVRSPVPFEDGLQVKRGGALALGAGDVHHGQIYLRLAKPRQQGADGMLVESRAGTVGSRIIADQTHEKFDGLIEGGDRPLSPSRQGAEVEINHRVPVPVRRVGGRPRSRY